MGPMAEDFWAGFAIGYGPQTIADLDARGVALAAIQGLNAKVEEQALTVAEQQREIAELRERVQKAETLAADVVVLKAAMAEFATRVGNRRGQVGAPAWFHALVANV